MSSWEGAQTATRTDPTVAHLDQMDGSLTWWAKPGVEVGVPVAVLGPGYGTTLPGAAASAGGAAAPSGSCPRGRSSSSATSAPMASARPASR
jgi:hypothetical protein